jgi:hypothetical protein
LQFDVEKRAGGGMRIEVCCAANPGTLLSAVSTLEVLGLEIEQCVVSCFSDFGMQASCSQVSDESWDLVHLKHSKTCLAKISVDFLVEYMSTVLMKFDCQRAVWYVE